MNPLQHLGINSKNCMTQRKCYVQRLMNDITGMESKLPKQRLWKSGRGCPRPSFTASVIAAVRRTAVKRPDHPEQFQKEVH
jgi:hypothetical protein